MFQQTLVTGIFLIEGAIEIPGHSHKSIDNPFWTRLTSYFLYTAE
jgi:hypothetical protein